MMYDGEPTYDVEEYFQQLQGKKLNINITVLSVTVNTVPTAKGSYQVADVAYKNNSFQGKIEGKKVMSFGATEGAFKTLVDGATGVTFDVEYVQTQGKDGKTYNNWVKMTKAGAPDAPQPVSATGAPRATGVAPQRTTYETPEERAIKQVYIVKQSSVSNAIATLSVGAKIVKPADVLELAQQYTDFVFGKKSPGASGFEDFPDVPDEFVKPV
jgi:hypothetical protein